MWGKKKTQRERERFERRRADTHSEAEKRRQERIKSGEDWETEAGSVDWVTLRRTDQRYETIAHSKVKLSRVDDSPALVDLEVENDHGSRTDIARSNVTVSRQKLIDALLQLPKESRS